MKSIKLKQYEVLKVTIDNINSAGCYFSLNFEHKYNECLNVHDSIKFISNIVNYLKNLEINKNSTLSFEANERNDKVLYSIVTKINKDSNLIDIILKKSDKEILFKCTLYKDIWIRKFKATIYYSLKYLEESYSSLDDNIRKKFYLDPFVNTLKKENDGISTIKIVKKEIDELSVILDHETEEEEEQLHYSILIDEKEIDTLRYVDIFALRDSALKENGEFYIYTCTCGIHECAGIDYPVMVYSDKNFLYWDLLEPYGGRFKFHKKAYQKEILEKLLL